MQTHIVLRNALNPKKKKKKKISKTLKTMKKGKVKESFNFFLVNHCDVVYMCSLMIEDTHNKKALIKGNLIKRDFIL